MERAVMHNTALIGATHVLHHEQGAFGALTSIRR
jgi:hypothetical protein